MTAAGIALLALAAAGLQIYHDIRSQHEQASQRSAASDHR